MKTFKLITVYIASFVLITGCGRDLSEKVREAADQTQQAQKLFSEHKYVEALTLTQKAMLLNTELQNDSLLADVYLLLATCQQQLGQYDSALTSYQNAVQYFHSINDQHLERRARIALAEFYYVMKKNSNALDIASDAATAAKVFSNIPDTYRALMIVAKASHALERYDQEITALQELAYIDSQAFHQQHKIDLMKMMFATNVAAKRPEALREVIGYWMKNVIATGDSAGLGEAYFAWGQYQHSFGRADSALRIYSLALDKFSGMTNRSKRLIVLSAIGTVAFSQQHFDNARMYFAEALNIARELQAPSHQYILQLAIAACDWKANMNGGSQLMDVVQRTVSIADSCHSSAFRLGEGFSHFLVGRMMEQRNDLPGAAQSYRQALNVYDELQRDTDEFSQLWDFPQAFMEEEHTGWYQALTQIYIAQEKTDSALSVLERSNLRELRGFFSGLTIRTNNISLNHAIERVQWKANCLRLIDHDITADLTTGSGNSSDRKSFLSKQYAEFTREHSLAIHDVNAINTNFQWLLYPPVFTTKYIRDTLPTGTALIEFAPMTNALSIIVVKHDTSIIRTKGVSRQYLVSLVREYTQLIGELRLSSSGLRLSEPAALQRINELSSVLYTILVAPIASEMKNVTKLYVVLPEEFGFLPYHTLRGDGGTLPGRGINVSYLPSSAILLFASQQEHTVRKVLGFGYPGHTSWDVEYELKDIRSFYEKTGMLFDTMATLNHLLDSTYDALHIAAEFHIDTQVPDNSFMVVADGATPFGVRNVPLGEILSVPVPQTLIFSNISPVAGSLFRYAPMAFLANGTHTVIATMWEGDRRAKKTFGEGFYTSSSEGLVSSESYHHAITTMMKREDLSHVQRWGLYYQFGR
jgi:tetratricopeptide (TPR) repeat protein